METPYQPSEAIVNAARSWVGVADAYGLSPSAIAYGDQLAAEISSKLAVAGLDLRNPEHVGIFLLGAMWGCPGPGPTDGITHLVTHARLLVEAIPLVRKIAKEG